MALLGQMAALFQSTLPHGERHTGQDGNKVERTVSIHAPARGATFAHASVTPVPLGFNPRSRTGSDRRQRLVL